MLNLDDLDFRIIRELGGSSSPQWNVRESYSNIAKKVGVDEETVRMRVKRARERGFLPAWRVMVNPLLIGCREANLDLEVKDEEHKTDAISKIKDVDGVHAIIDFRGKEIVLQFYYRDDESLAEKVRLVESICGSEKMALWNNPFLTPDASLKTLDWKIIDAMREDAWRDLDEVSKSLGVSSRTVQRRLTALVEGKAVYLSRPPNANVVGGLMCNFYVFCPDPNKKRTVDYQIHSTFTRIGASETSHEQFSNFGISCENFADADRVVEKMKAIDGVETVRMRVIKDIYTSQDWIKGQIAAQLQSETSG